MSRATERAAKEPLTRSMVIRAFVKALCLFAAVNLIYSLIQPVQNGWLPSLYNVIFAGRNRLIKGYEFDPYGLVRDHAIVRAQSDTFNILMAGSSEIWGSRAGPAQSVPTYLDKLNLVASDGRPVRVYNLGYPFPFAFKDLTLIEVALQQHIPIDLVILSSFDATFSMTPGAQRISAANVVLEKHLIDHYGLPSKYFEPDPLKINDLDLTFLPLWNDRNQLSDWASMQMRGLVWNFMTDDMDTQMVDFRKPVPPLQDFFPPVTLDRVHPEDTMLRAFAQFRNEKQIPVIILAAPIPVEVNDFAPWLRDQTQVFGFPLIDCWEIYRTLDRFEDYYHISRETHETYAHTLAQALNNKTFEDRVPGLPLTLPTNFVPPSESCAVYSSQDAEP